MFTEYNDGQARDTSANGGVGMAAEGGHDRTLGAGSGLICIVLIAVALRPAIVSVGPVLPAIRDQFGLTHARASLLTSIPTVLMGMLALPSPWIAHRFGRDRAILAALVLLLLSTVLRAWSHSTVMLLLTTSGVGAGIAIAGALIAGFVKGHFPDRAAFLMGIYGTALGVGSTVAAATTGLIAGSVGWRTATALWALPCLSAIATWVYVERRVGQRRTEAAAKRYPLPLRNPTAWAIALFNSCDNLVFYAALSWTAPRLHEHGMSTASAGMALASYTVGFLVANPVFGSLSRSEDRRPLLAISAALMIIGLFWQAMWPDALPFLALPLTGFGIGGGFTLGNTLPLDNTRDTHEANAWNAMSMTIGYLAASAGPLALGALRDSTGSFGPGLWMLVGLAIMMLGFTPFLRPHQHRRAFGGAEG